jgi:hypothetical protein
MSPATVGVDHIQPPVSYCQSIRLSPLLRVEDESVFSDFSSLPLCVKAAPGITARKTRALLMTILVHREGSISNPLLAWLKAHRAHKKSAPNFGL